MSGPLVGLHAPSQITERLVSSRSHVKPAANSFFIMVGPYSEFTNLDPVIFSIEYFPRPFCCCSLLHPKIWSFCGPDSLSDPMCGARESLDSEVNFVEGINELRISECIF